MRAKFEHLLPALMQAARVPGDFMELGVWHGETFLPLAKVAGEQGRLAHAVDSFVGMAPPSPQDFDAERKCEHPEGSLSVGGPAAIREKTAGMAHVRLHVGFIPAILAEIETPAGLALVHVDLDQYSPTLAALRWVWARTNPGGIVICHDYFEGMECMASLAIQEFLAQERIPLLDHNPFSHHVWFRKEMR